MAINLTSEQILDLMRELGSSHWLYGDLLAELNTLAVQPPVEPYSIEAFEKSASDFRAEVVEPLKSSDTIVANKSKTCLYEVYGHQCVAVQAKDGFCLEHMETVCREPGCENQMTHGCPTEMQFVCGAPLCNEHRSCSDHGRY